MNDSTVFGVVFKIVVVEHDWLEKNNSIRQIILADLFWINNLNLVSIIFNFEESKIKLRIRKSPEISIIINDRRKYKYI